jgi:hypothetical protein
MTSLGTPDLRELSMMNPISLEASEPEHLIREVDSRRTDGIEVTLLWNAHTDGVFVSVVDERNGVVLQFQVAPADALDAFKHPYAYTGKRRDNGAVAA